MHAQEEKDERRGGIFSIPCTIGECTFVNARLDLGALINFMPISIYKSLNFSDLEPIGMTIQLAERSIVQPLDVLVQVNDMIFLADFYVLDMEDEKSGKGSTLIIGQPFFMIARTKIDVHVGTLSMEFAMKHPTEDRSLFGIDVIDELVAEYTVGTEQMENNDRTLKELATPDMAYQPWCIQYPQLEPTQIYKLKSGLIHLLPKFHGIVGEDPHKHSKEFHVVCSAIRPKGILEDYIKMKAFPFSLDGAAKDWIYLQPEICGIRQHFRETLHEYWGRFNKLCATCPHHQISEQLMIQYFYEGLTMMD
ncbi:hypothetical protein CR513_21771, partial [Mucuna pruriens]